MRQWMWGWVGLVVAGASHAQVSPVESTMQVSAGVPASCVIDAQGGIHLPQYDPVAKTGGQAAEGQTSIAFKVRCNRQTAPVYVSLDEGLSPSAGSSCASPDRNMVSESGQRLPYRLYWEANGSVQWGCEGDNRLAVDFGQAVENQLKIWTVVPAGMDADVGDYSDTVMISLTF